MPSAFVISAVATVAMLVIAFLMFVLPKPGAAPAAPAPTPPPPPPQGTAGPTPNPGAGSPVPKPSDEVRDFWQVLGLVDDAPNGYRAVVSGSKGTGQILYYLADRDGVSTNPNVRPRATDRVTRIVERITGKRVFGLPFVTSLRSMDIDRVVKKSTQIKQEVALYEQIVAPGAVSRQLLYREINRPTYHEALDTIDGVRFNIISDAVINVIDPEPGFMRYQHSFLQTLSDRIGNYIATQVNNMDWETYKKHKAGINKFDLAGLNEVLKDLGVEVVRLTVSDPEIAKGSPEVQAALEAAKIAEERAKAKRKEGEGQRDYAISIAEGNAQAVERLAKAEAARFEELFLTFRKNGLTEAQAIHLAQQTIIAEVNAEAIGKLTTYAPGNPGGVQLSVPVGGGEK